MTGGNVLVSHNGDDGNHDSDIEDDGGDHGDDSYGDGDIDNGRVECTISPLQPKTANFM